MTGAVNSPAALIPNMVARGEGHVLISSVAGYGGLVTSAAYASKAALFNMGESLAMDLKDSGVHISMVAPGFVKTPATDVNEFAMPFIIEADEAARRIADSLAKNKTYLIPAPLFVSSASSKSTAAQRIREAGRALYGALKAVNRASG